MSSRKSILPTASKGNCSQPQVTLGNLKKQDGRPLSGGSSIEKNKSLIDLVTDTATCKVCMNTFSNKNDKLIECGRCTEWVCITCAKLSAAAYKVCGKPDSPFHWFCEDCTVSALTAVKTDQLIEERCKQHFESFKEEVADMIDQKVEEKIEKVEEKIDTRLQEGNINIEDIVNEIKERKERENNVIMFNVPESVNMEPADRKIDDVAKALKICEMLEVDAEFTQAIRLGKKKPLGEHRPLRLTTVSAEMANNLTFAARKFADLDEEDEMRKIAIRRDMTPLEREEMRKLLQMREKRKRESTLKGENSNWIIRRGKVVLGRPPQPLVPEVTMETMATELNT